MAGNQLGKTLSGAAETAIHCIGGDYYPSWWEGKRFDHPVQVWAAGVTTEGTRDNPQRMLFGQEGELGTGMIPESCIEKITLARGLAHSIDTALIRHESGGLSRISFKAYEQKREKFQGATLDVLWLDEEPPADVFSEAITRINAGDHGRGGIAYITFTPLMGLTDVVSKFFPEPDSVVRHVTHMTIDDVDHYSEERKAEITDAYPAHERESRALGIPSLGSGKVFPIEEDLIKVEQFEIPDHYAQIVGIDFGWDHPFAAVRLAIDRDSDCIYVVDTYRQRETTPPVHASAIKRWGSGIRVAWPHDGHIHDRGSGEPLSLLYRKEGLRMLPEHATFEKGGYSLEAGVLEMFTRMQTGRLKVFSHLRDWWDEFRIYHRKAGKIVKERDDLMSAMRQGVMAMRHARSNQKTMGHTKVTSLDYDPLTPKGLH